MAESSNRRTLVVAGTILAVLVLGAVAAFLMLREPDTRPARSAATARPDSPKPSISPADQKTQVEQAYLRYWDAWTKANLDLDPGGLKKVMAEDALDKAVQVINEQRAANEPVLIRFEDRKYEVALLPEGASVDETFTDRSVRADPATKQPTGAAASEQIRNAYTFKRVDGAWKVTFLTGYQP